MALRLEPKDELMHELGPEPNFNESMYFNVYDPASRVGGFFRLGNRANEAMAEMTVCVYLPDGRVAFMFGRPAIHDNDSFDAGGLRFAVVEPFCELTVDYDGSVAVLADPLEMADPRRAFSTNPHLPCRVEVRYTGAGPMVGGEPEERRERPGEEFARGHYEQLVAATGSIEIGNEEFPIEGFGLRDHSWGARYWQAPWYYRWLTANFGPGFGFAGSRVARRDGPGIRGGFVWDGTELRLCDGLSLSTTWTGEASYHSAVDAVLTAGAREWRVHGRVFSLIPLRNRRTDPAGNKLVTRISEGMTEWTLEDGRVGYGLSEYLDQIVDGEPVGLAE